MTDEIKIIELIKSSNLELAIVLCNSLGFNYIELFEKAVLEMFYNKYISKNMNPSGGPWKVIQISKFNITLKRMVIIFIL